MSVDTHFDDHVDDVMGRLHTAVADASGLSLTSLSPSQLNTWLVAMVRLVAQAQGLQALAMQEAEAAGLAPRYGSRILTTHIVKETHTNAKVVGADRSMAIWLRDFPLLHQALIDGVLSRSHLVELKSSDNPNIHLLLQRDQQMFVDGAAQLEWQSWKQVLAYWLNAADPDGKLTDPTNPEYGMAVQTKANGDVWVTIRMDPVTGEAFLAMHEPEVEKISRTEREHPNIPPMSTRKKNLCALMRLMTRGFTRENGTTPVPLINIVMSQTVAEDLLARGFGHITPPHGWDVSAPRAETPLASEASGELPIDWDDIDGRCETIRGTPIHPKHALGLLLIGKLRRTVMEPDARNLELGHDVRFFNEAQRNALLVLSRGQCVDGTQDPYAWLQAEAFRQGMFWPPGPKLRKRAKRATITPKQPRQRKPNQRLVEHPTPRQETRRERN